MSNDNLDYGKKLSSLYKQTFSMQRYKEYGIIPSIILGILLLPIFLIVGALGLMYEMIYALYRIFSSPADYLISLIRHEGKEVRHLTQFIIYAIGFPTVFLMNVILALYSVSLFILYLFISIFCQVLSLGGTEWIPFLNDPRERKALEPLKNPLFNAILKVVYFLVLIIVGIILEAVEAIAFPAVLIILCYIVALLLMPFNFTLKGKKKSNTKNPKEEKVSNDSVVAETSDEPVASEPTNIEEPKEVKQEESAKVEESKESKKDKAVSDKNNDSPKCLSKIQLATYIAGGFLLFFSVLSIVMFIFTRAYYLYKSVAFNITLSFTIISFLLAIGSAVAIVFLYRKNKSKGDVSLKSPHRIFALAAVGVSLITAVSGVVCSSVEFYPQIDQSRRTHYYGYYQGNKDGHSYRVRIDKKIEMTISDSRYGYSKTFTFNYYFGDMNYCEKVGNYQKAEVFFADTSMCNFRIPKTKIKVFENSKEMPFLFYYTGYYTLYAGKVQLTRL